MSIRCYVPDLAAWENGAGHLPDDAAHHCARVLRTQPGDPLTLFNGQGLSATAEITDVTKRHVGARVVESLTIPKPTPDIVLVQSLIRPQPMDFVVRKATELGVGTLQPVLTDRCVVRTRERPERWMKTVVSAAEQCGQDWLPAIEPVRTWKEVVSSWRSTDVVLIGALDASARPMKDVVRAAAAPERVVVCVGPEGDFTPDELTAALAAGARPVQLGSLTLRAETASLMLLSALRYEFG